VRLTKGRNSVQPKATPFRDHYEAENPITEKKRPYAQKPAVKPVYRAEINFYWTESARIRRRMIRVVAASAADLQD
jgi:hypothetical protein